MADCPDIWIYNSMQLQGLNKRVKGRQFCTVVRARRCAGSRSKADMLRFVLRRQRARPALASRAAGRHFLLIHAGAVDPAVAMAGESATPEQIERLRKQYGLDRPIWEQFAVYVDKVGASTPAKAPSRGGR